MTPSTAQDEAEEDYMTMILPDDPTPRNETSIQRRARKQREAESRAHPKSKSQLDREAREARDTALSSSILTSNPENKGAKMLAKLGYKSGPLGVGGDPAARIEPISLAMKEDKSGIGHESEMKRKFRDEAEMLKIDMKKRKVNEDEFRERVQRERMEKRTEGQLWAAMKVAERLEETEPDTYDNGDRESGDKAKPRPVRTIPLVWRALVRQRVEQEYENGIRRMKHASLPQSRLPEVEDPDEDEDDKRALGKEDKDELLDEDIEEDPELDEFNTLDVEERLQKLLVYLREKHRYCFWCKYQYPDKAMDGCPGTTEDEHG